MGGPDVINRLGLNLYFKRTGNRGQDVRAGWDGQVSYSPNQIFSDVCELTNGLKWEMCPEVLYHVPLAYWQKYGLSNLHHGTWLSDRRCRGLPKMLGNCRGH